ncbi:MAG: energy transducer TonB [Myxococcales bacterium]|nr:energy transducer TonB [Myxococcales bacterium]
MKPKKLDASKPSYPPLYESQGLEADVVVEVQIDVRGEVTSVRVVTPSPHAEFDESAVAHARKSRFSPATRDGAPVPWTLTYTVRFRLDE